MSTPIFIEIDAPTKALDGMDKLKQKLLEAKQVLHEIHGLRLEENAAVQALETEVSEMKGRVTSMQEEIR